MELDPLGSGHDVVKLFVFYFRVNEVSLANIGAVFLVWLSTILEQRALKVNRRANRWCLAGFFVFFTQQI